MLRYRFVLLFYLLAWFIGSFLLMGFIKSGLLKSWTGIDFGPLEEYVYFALAGSIGGTLYAMRMFHEYYDRMNERWTLWYLIRPFQCAGAAVMTIILFQSGIMLLQTGSSMESKIGVAFLVGFGFGKMMDKLKHLTESLFIGKNDDNTPPDNEPRK